MVTSKPMGVVWPLMGMDVPGTSKLASVKVLLKSWCETASGRKLGLSRSDEISCMPPTELVNSKPPRPGA